MGDAVRDSSEAKTLTPSAHAESRARPSLEDMHASRALFQSGGGDNNKTSNQDFLDCGDPSGLYGSSIMLAQAPQKKPEYERGADGRWHFENPRAHGNDIAGKLKEWLWNDAPNVPRDTVNGAWPLVEQAVIKANDTAQGHFRTADGWHDLDLKACDKAFNAFPKLAQYQLPREVVAGLILNEIRHRDLKDGTEDLSVRLIGTVRNYDGSENRRASIGPAQMQIGTIRELAGKYPQLAEFRDPVKAALDPDKAPLFVAAYLTEHLSSLERHNAASPKQQVPINLASVLYSYNPDVAVRNEAHDPDANDYRAYTAAEKLENSVTHRRAASAADWHSVWFATTDKITTKSEVVRNMLDGIAAIEAHNHQSGR